MSIFYFFTLSFLDLWQKPVFSLEKRILWVPFLESSMGLPSIYVTFGLSSGLQIKEIDLFLKIPLAKKRNLLPNLCNSRFISFLKSMEGSFFCFYNISVLEKYKSSYWFLQMTLIYFCIWVSKSSVNQSATVYSTKCKHVYLTDF